MNHPKHRPDIEAEDGEHNSRQLSNDLSRLLDENSIVLDIGANRGQFAQELLSSVSVKNIYSFEPVPDAYAELVVIANSYPQIIPISKAVSSENGSTSFYITKSDVGSSLLPPLPGQSSQWLTLEKELTVETVRLDYFISNNLINVDEKKVSLLKSDAQGADLAVIQSAGEYLTPDVIKAILIEINFTNFYENQRPYYEILSQLDKSGYRMAWMYPYRANDKWLWWADVLFVGK